MVCARDLFSNIMSGGNTEFPIENLPTPVTPDERGPSIRRPRAVLYKITVGVYVST